QRMIDDHRVADGKFKHALAEAKLPPPPAKLSAEHRAVLADLKSKKAAAFDKAYIEAQYTAHVETVDLFKAYAEAGDNARLQFFAREILPPLRSIFDRVGKRGGRRRARRSFAPATTRGLGRRADGTRLRHGVHRSGRRGRSLAMHVHVSRR